MANDQLTPPILNNVIPAFYKNPNGTFQIKVPFGMNRGVSALDIAGFVLRVKSVQKSSFLFELTAINEGEDFDLDDLTWVNFNGNKEDFDKIKVGQYYKIQLAYIKKNSEDLKDFSQVGLFSSNALIKCTSLPSVIIKGLNPTTVNTHSFFYTGIYNQEDISERVYSYSFNLYNSEYELIKTSGEILHNSSEDVSLIESQDSFSLPDDLKYNKFYYIEYAVTTLNGLKAVSPRYRIMQKLTIKPEINATVVATSNTENGYVDISLYPINLDLDLKDLLVSGDFILSRSSEDSDYSVWYDISKFELYSQYPARRIWRDFTVEQGKKYKYAIRQYNDVGLHSDRLESNEVFVDFDYAFLTDKNRQLKIKFNSKISSFKTNIPETKIDTMGNKYPFIFRNSQVKYYEFPISGLISYYMDDENLFLKKDEFKIDFNSLEQLQKSEVSDNIFSTFENNNNIATTNITASNVQNERFFKLKVLEWLTDGNPKLFRSPTEGNYVVRLLNCSLTPMDQLGRMLHSFNCTAYEIADFNYKSLEDYGFIDMANTKDPILQFETVEFYNQKTNVYASGVLNRYPTNYIQIENALPGSQFIITFKNKKREIITVGATGSYSLKFKVEISKIEIPSGNKYSQGSLTYGYYYIKVNTFETIHNAITEDIISHQFIGAYNNIIEEIEFVPNEKGIMIKNPKKEILQLYNLAAYNRPVEKINYEPTFETIRNIYPLYYYNSEYYDFSKDELIKYTEENEEFNKLGFEYKGVSYTQLPYKIDNFEEIGSIKTYPRTILEISYQIQDKEYLVEKESKEDSSLYTKRLAYQNAEETLNNLLQEEVPEDVDEFNKWYKDYPNREKSARIAVKTAYQNYVLELDSVLNPKKED